MALITCPDCKAKVSDSAPACPNCGRPSPKERAATESRRSGKIMVALGTIVLLVVLVYTIANPSAVGGVIMLVAFGTVVLGRIVQG
jgi:uncharacterized integral membrane protein